MYETLRLRSRLALGRFHKIQPLLPDEIFARQLLNGALARIEPRPSREHEEGADRRMLLNNRQCVEAQVLICHGRAGACVFERGLLSYQMKIGQVRIWAGVCAAGARRRMTRPIDGADESCPARAYLRFHESHCKYLVEPPAGRSPYRFVAAARAAQTQRERPRSRATSPVVSCK
ncbi:hypothetical protein EVAR_12912_1 [Eumeta japonica]|uniref:Uncharacterized protein n=1 Tax=Eumeta variegata TaxID=151549 RepID=A0A4C1TVS7_EUMVA|nr:hypothetical protein EVAR_12912_1 [Eumeta japonica]